MVPYDAGDHFEQIFLLYVDAGGRSLLIGDCLENCWLGTSNSCNNKEKQLFSKMQFVVPVTSDDDILFWRTSIWNFIALLYL